jgi:hypothetical protein
MHGVHASDEFIGEKLPAVQSLQLAVMPTTDAT